VLGASKLSREAELAAREAFWYREALLSMLQGTWHDAEQGRRGEIDLRSMRLSERMVATVRVEEVGVELSVSARAPTTVQRVRPATYTVPTRRFLTLTTTVHNRTAQPIYPLVRLQPTLRHQPPDVAVDLAKKFLWHGVLQRGMPLLRAGEKVSVELGVCVLCRGEFEVGASVEEGRLWESGAVQEGTTKGKSVRGEQEKATARRRWGAREGCVLIARDISDDDDDHDHQAKSADDDEGEE
jgi:hypothetical protein